MKALGILLVWLGYSFFVYGTDKAGGKCTSYKTIAWPASAAGDISASCSQSTSSSSSSRSSSTPPTAQQQAQTAYNQAGPTSAAAAQQANQVPNARGGVGNSPYGPYPS